MSSDSRSFALQYMLDAIGAGSQKRVGNRPWSDVYRDSELFQENLKMIAQLKEECLAQPDSHEQVKEYATNFTFQLKTVFNRTLLASWRQPDYQFTRLFQHGAIALVTSLVFLQLGNSVASLQYRVFGIFIATVVPAIVLAQIEPFYIMARSTFIREDSSKMYTGKSPIEMWKLVRGRDFKSLHLQSERLLLRTLTSSFYPLYLFSLYQQELSLLSLN